MPPQDKKKDDIDVFLDKSDDIDSFFDTPSTKPVETSGNIDEIDTFLGIQEAQQASVPITEQELFPNDPGFEQNPFKSFGKSIFNTVTNQLPAAAAGALLSQSDNLNVLSGKLDEFLLPKLGLTPELKKQFDELNPNFNKEVKKEVRNSLLDFAIKKQKKGGELSQELVQSLSQIDSPLDALNWASVAFGQGIAQIPAAVLSGGTTSVAQEIGSIYLDSVTRIAEERGITPEEVLDRGLDDPAAALGYGLVAGSLERLGAGRVLKSFGRTAVVKDLKARGAIALRGVFDESITEGAQQIVESIAVSRSAKQSFSDALKEVKPLEVLDAAAAGAVAGGGISAIGTFLPKTKESDKQPPSEPSVEQKPEPKTIPPEAKEPPKKVQPKPPEITEKPKQAVITPKPEVKPRTGDVQADKPTTIPVTKGKIEPVTEGLPENIKGAKKQAEVPPKTEKQKAEESTSIKNVDVLRDRQELFGLDEINSPERLTFRKTLESARKNKTDEKALRIAEEIDKKPRPLTPQESAGITVKMGKLKLEYEKLNEEIGKIPEGDMVTLRAKAAEAETIEKEFDILTQATQRGGTPAAQSLVFRKLTIDRDLRLLPVRNRAKAAAAQGGKTVPEKVQAQLKGLVKKLEAKTKEADAFQTKIRELEANTTIKKNRIKKKGVSKEAKDAELSKLMERAKQLMSEGCL